MYFHPIDHFGKKYSIDKKLLSYLSLGPILNIIQSHPQPQFWLSLAQLSPSLIFFLFFLGGPVPPLYPGFPVCVRASVRNSVLEKL